MSVVCTVHLFSTVEIGHLFVVSGVLKKNPKTFKINFLLRDDDSEIETPLSISCNLNEKLMNVKSLTSQTLDRGKVIRVEEITDTFKFYILMLDKCFNISFNNQKLCKYDYKSGLDNIKVVRIFGDVDTVKQVDHRKTYPSPWPQLHEDLSSVAFSCDVACKYSPYSIIVLRGKISGNPKGSFFIRFNELGSKKQLFHFNPRFDEEVIVINSMNDDLDWLLENRCHKFPFTLNKDFQMAILIDNCWFHVAVNGEQLLRFPIRLPQSTMLKLGEDNPIFEKLTGFKIFGLHGLEVKINYVDFFNIKQEDRTFYEIFSDGKFM